MTESVKFSGTILPADDSAILFDQALGLQNAGRQHEALPLLDILAARHPDIVEVHRNRAAACVALGLPAEMLKCFERILALDPGDLDTRIKRGVLLQYQGRTDEARRDYDFVLARRREDAEVLYNMSTLLHHEGRVEEAASFCRRSLASQPMQPLANFNLAIFLEELGRFDEALEFYTCGIAQTEDPALRAEMEWGKGLCLLKIGRLEEGWPLYEARIRGNIPVKFPDGCPIWTGRQPLAEKTLLIHAEQGLGDTIQFCRYLRLAATRGGRVIFSCPRRLHALLAPLEAWVELVDETAPPPAADYHVLLMSLPLALATPILSGTPYLTVRAADRAAWASKLGASGFKIGVCWRSGPDHPTKGRDYPLGALAEIGGQPGVRLISLQQDARRDELEQLPAGMTVEHFDDFDTGSDGFLDTAAVMAELDLVITCDTATAHLAGALGRPCWVAIPYVPDWRWMLDRSDSPWYPTMRLFRQQSRHNWPSVFAEMKVQLHEQIRFTAVGTSM